MTLNLIRGLWLWAGVLVVTLALIIPASGWVRAAAILTVVLAWVWAERRFAKRGAQLLPPGETPLPAATYRQPVVLVCGDGLTGLFGAVPADQLALRVTAQGCYVRVPALDQLGTAVAGVLTQRPDWGGQLNVMFCVNPVEHTDDGELAGRIRAFRHQLTLARKRGLALPLMLVSYGQTTTDEDAWFSCESGEPDLWVRSAGACASLSDWQRQAVDSAHGTERLAMGVQVGSLAAWLKDKVLSHFTGRDGRVPLVWAMTLVPAVPQRVPGNLWQQWLRVRVALGASEPSVAGASLPFPDPLLNLLPLRIRRSARLRAGILAVWLFTLAGVVALASSAWQNNLLLRQVSDDLRRYHAIPLAERRDQPQFLLRENAVAVLREDAARLDDYYRQGEPLALGLGLYRGERLRLPLLATIAAHRQPPEAPPPVKIPDPVRLDSLSLFDPGRAELKAGSTKVLIDALVNIKAQAGWLIVIAGHTDITGSPGQNLELSRARAASVRDWMQRMGDIPDSCFAVQGFGAQQPVASNDTDAGRAANRRVDIRLVPEAGACALPAAGPGKTPPVAFRDMQTPRKGASNGNSRLPLAAR